MVGEIRVFYFINLTDHKRCELVVINTMDGEDNLEEKNREDADIRICHFG